jgi:hypothetical protein
MNAQNYTFFTPKSTRKRPDDVLAGKGGLCYSRRHPKSKLGSMARKQSSYTRGFEKEGR